MSEPSLPPAEPTLDLKNRWLAGFLALLVPGLGHLYQGRIFKSVVYAVCVLGLFFSGQALGDWKVVYLGDSDAAGGRINAGRFRLVGQLLQGYGAQFPVGVFAWPAVVQSKRYRAPENVERAVVSEPLESVFSGGLWADTDRGPVNVLSLEGTVRLEPAGGPNAGHFIGTGPDGRKVELDLARVRELGRKVSANAERTLDAIPAELPQGLDVPPGAGTPYFKGAILRPLTDRYQVPLGDRGEDELTAKLGGRLEIAYVFTWVAGLLNVLAIWDALDGPAYGFGHEPELNEKRRKRRRKPGGEPEPARRPEPVGRAV